MHVGYLLGLLLGSAAASPLAEPATPAAAAFCSVVTGLVTNAKAQKPATSYCSSFLGIKTVTVRTTVPSVLVEFKTVEVATSTSTATVTVPADPATITVTPTASCTVPAVGKRAVAKPACFSAYTVAPLITSACKCLSIATPTVTSTATVGVTTSTSTVTINTLASTTVTETSPPATETTVASFKMFNLANNQQYAGWNSRAIPGAVGVTFITSRDFGTSFSFTSTCGLQFIDSPTPNWISYGSAGQPVKFFAPGDTPESGFAPLSCLRNTLTGLLQCSLPGGAAVNNLCDVPDPRNPDPNGGPLTDVWYLDSGVTNGPRGACTPFTIGSE